MTDDGVVLYNRVAHCGGVVLQSWKCNGCFPSLLRSCLIHQIQFALFVLVSFACKI